MTLETDLVCCAIIKMQDHFNERNFTGIDYPYTIWHVKPDWEIGVKSTTFLIIVSFGVFINATVLTATLDKRHLGVPINYFFVSTAVADIATLLISPLMVLCRDVFQNYELGFVGCKFEAFLEIAFLCIDVINLFFITCIRLMAVAKPQKINLSRRNIYMALIVTWVLAFAATSPLITYRSYREIKWGNFLEKYCEEDNNTLSLYWNIVVAVMIWTPLAFMLISYCIFFCNLEHLTDALEQQHHRRVKFRKRAAKIIFAVIVVFILCRVPFTVLVFWKGSLLQDSASHTFGYDFEALWFTANTLLFTNAAINPILYGLTNREFQKSLKESWVLGWVFPKEAEELTNNNEAPVWTVPKLTPRRLSASK